MNNFNLLGIAVSIFIILIAYIKWKLTYWKSLGLPTLSPTIFFGDTKQLFCGKSTFGEQFQQFYNEFKARGHRHGGIYFGITPFYVPVDHGLIKLVLRTDFQHFVNHGVFIDEEIDPLSGHLFNLEDTKWKNLRSKMTPTFTSAKIKMMFQTLVDCAVGLKEVLDDLAIRREVVDITDVLGRFGTDVIGSVAFGLECNSLKNSDSLFRKYGTKVFDDNAWDRMKSFLQFILPRSILKIAKFRMNKKDVEKFYMKTVRDTVAYREKNNIYRKDFMHMLLQLKNRGRVFDDEKITDDDGNIDEKGLTMNELTAQAFVFFIAGFESFSITVTFALFELAMNPEIQEKLRNEIDSVLAKYGDRLMYDAVMEMTYMDKVLYETLRKYPPVNILVRRCTKEYVVPQTNIIIKEGINVGIPILGVHNDPDFYPDPEVFDPERFSEENKKTRPDCTWLPFGEGPRICIGMKFGLLQSKVSLATILRNYKVIINKKTRVPIVFDKYKLLTSALGGIWLDIEKV